MKIPPSADSSQAKELLAQFEKYGGIFFAAAMRKLGNHHDAEDALQEAYAQLLKRPGNLLQCDENQKKAYILRVVHNQACDLYRRRQRAPALALPEDDSGQAVPEAEQRGPDSVALSQEGVAELKKAIEDLDEPFRSVIQWSIYFEFSDAEIAQKLNVKQATVRVYRQRARQKLEQILEKRRADP